MAGGKSSRGGPSGSISSKKKKKGKPLSKDPARLAAAIATLSNWAAWGLSCADHRTLALPRMDLHTHSTCSQSSLCLSPNKHAFIVSFSQLCFVSEGAFTLTYSSGRGYGCGSGPLSTTCTILFVYTQRILEV